MRDTECRANKTDILSLPDYHRLGKEAKIKIPVLCSAALKAQRAKTRTTMSVKVEKYSQECKLKG